MAKATEITLEQVRAALAAHPWIYAKTMPNNPHEYTLRRRWRDEQLFTAVVQFIRDHGRKEYFHGRPYMQLVVDDYTHWTMGAPLPETILINRKHVEGYPPERLKAFAEMSRRHEARGRF